MPKKPVYFPGFVNFNHQLTVSLTNKLCELRFAIYDSRFFNRQIDNRKTDNRQLKQITNYELRFLIYELGVKKVEGLKGWRVDKDLSRN